MSRKPIVSNRENMPAGLVEAEGRDMAEWPLTDAQKAELDRRLEEIDRDPDGAEDIAWEDLREELLRRIAQRRASAA